MTEYERMRIAANKVLLPCKCGEMPSTDVILKTWGFGCRQCGIYGGEHENLVRAAMSWNRVISKLLI